MLKSVFTVTVLHIFQPLISTVEVYGGVTGEDTIKLVRSQFTHNETAATGKQMAVGYRGVNRSVRTRIDRLIGSWAS